MNKRETKITTLVALIIGVVALTVGFAAFSRNLTIASSARYTTSETDLDVVFSIASDRVTTGQVNATTGGATGGSFLILPMSPTSISGISVSFTATGQKVVYDFYVYNNSDYKAYFSDVTMSAATGATANERIVCSAATNTDGSATNATLVEDACDNIKYTLSRPSNGVYDNVDMFIVSGNSTSGEFKKNLLGAFNANYIPAKSAYPLRLTIEYNSSTASVIPDGNFNVNIGTLTLTFSTQNR